MLHYRIDRQQDDGSWSTLEFQAVNDDHAIAHALRLRTANTCELYQAERWLATFDRAPKPEHRWLVPANDNTIPVRSEQGLRWRPRSPAG